jgi:cell division septation protein DedD
MVLLREHNTIVRDQLQAHGGHEVKAEGDGFMVVFSEPARALHCALAIQSALAARNATAEQPLRVRIGLHVGEAIKESDDFFGTAVIMAARVGARADGGEILVSNVFKAVAGSAGDVQFDEGQDVALKGFSGVHRVYKVFWNEREKPCPSCSKPIPIDARSCPHCTLPLGFDQPPALTEEFTAPRATLSAAQPSRASTITRVAVAGIAMVALAGLVFGSFKYSQVLKERRVALEHLEQAHQAAAAAEQRAREEGDKLKQQEDQAKAAADAERAKQEEAQRQEEERKKQVAEAREKERQAKKKAEQEAAAQMQSAPPAEASAQDGAAGADTTIASAKPTRGKHGKLTKASLPKGKYHIDVDGVRERADAEALAAKLQKLGFTAYLVPSEDDEGLWVVRIGPFRTQDEADAAQRDMADKYQASLKN